MICFFKFHIAHISLIMFGICKTKHSSQDCNRYLVGERVCSFIITFEQVIKPFFVWNIYFTFFLSVVDCTFYKSTINCNVYYFYVTYASEAVVRGMLCKKHVLRNFTKFTGKQLHQSLRGSKVAVVLFLQNTSGGCFWCFRVNLHSMILELARDRCNIWILGEQ